MQTKTQVREFTKETSVFRQWYKETPAKMKESVESDCQLWKLHKFINKKGDEGQIEACQAILLKH